MDRRLKELIEQALAEDLGHGDITTESVIPPGSASTAEIMAKQDLVAAGIMVAGEVFHVLDPVVQYTPAAKDGDRAHAGTVLASLSGNTRTLLAGERVALNLLQHLSGIATLTARYGEQLKGFKAKLLDTRKTLPGLRDLEKYAVRMGGGENHRFGLSDGVMIKDNHITAAGNLTTAVKRAREHCHHLIKIEVETRTLEEVEEALNAGADVIMLDNMAVDMMKKAVDLINGRALVEASGNVTLDTIRAIAGSGVDLISVGSLTHSAPAVDISMKINHGSP